MQLVKLENVLSLALHLREVAEDFQKKKVRDVQDFEWVRNPRYYSSIQGPCGINLLTVASTMITSYGLTKFVLLVRVSL